jgi:NADPH-dependent methylglyoxal reductase
MSRVFITGASGFIAQHIVKLFISKGYHVIGTVRSAEKGERLVTQLGSNFEYVIVPDIVTPGAFDEALQKHTNIKYLLHTASPFFYDTTDPEKDLIIPAINGTKNILNAAHTYRPEIKKIIITSSDAAIYSSVDEQNSALSFDETSWNNISYEEAVKDPVAAYYGAKSFAEKLAWEFLNNNKTSFSLTTVNPVYVFGPQAFDSDVGPVLNVSNELIHSLIKLTPEDEFVNDKGSFIDVRDVALAHLKAVEDDNLIGKRLFLSNGQFSTQMMVDVLNEKFPQLKGMIPKGSPGSGPADILTLATSNNDKTRELLGFEFIDFQKIIVDTIEQVLKVKKLSPSL